MQVLVRGGPRQHTTGEMDWAQKVRTESNFLRDWRPVAPIYKALRAGSPNVMKDTRMALTFFGLGAASRPGLHSPDENHSWHSAARLGSIDAVMRAATS